MVLFCVCVRRDMGRKGCDLCVKRRGGGLLGGDV